MTADPLCRSGFCAAARHCKFQSDKIESAPFKQSTGKPWTHGTASFPRGSHKFNFPAIPISWRQLDTYGMFWNHCHTLPIKYSSKTDDIQPSGQPRRVSSTFRRILCIFPDYINIDVSTPLILSHALQRWTRKHSAP